MTDAMREKRMGSTGISMAAEIRMAERDKQKELYFAELDKISREKEMLEEMMENSQGAYIKVDGTMYRNVVICVNVEQLTLNRNNGYMKYTADNGVLEGNVIIH